MDPSLFFARLFGAKRPPSAASVDQLAEARFKVNQTAADLCVRVRDQQTDIRQLMRNGQRPSARIKLEASKQTSARIEHCHKIIATLDSAIEVAEMARINQLSVEAVRTASVLLRAALATMGPEAVAEVQDDMDELVRQANEVQSEAARPIAALRGPPTVARDLERELDTYLPSSSDEEEEEEEEEEATFRVLAKEGGQQFESIEL